MKESSRRGVPLPGIAEPTKARPTGSGTIPEEGQSIVSSGNSARRPRRSVASAREGEALDSFLQNLTREAWAWQIYAGIVALLFVTAAGFLLTVGAVTGSVLIGVGGAGKSESRFLLAYAGILCGVLAAACVPAVVIGIIRGKRVAALGDRPHGLYRGFAPRHEHRQSGAGGLFQSARPGIRFEKPSLRAKEQGTPGGCPEPTAEGW